MPGAVCTHQTGQRHHRNRSRDQRRPNARTTLSNCGIGAFVCLDADLVVKAGVHRPHWFAGVSGAAGNRPEDRPALALFLR